MVVTLRVVVITRNTCQSSKQLIIISIKQFIYKLDDSASTNAVTSENTVSSIPYGTTSYTPLRTQ